MVVSGGILDTVTAIKNRLLEGITLFVKLKSSYQAAFPKTDCFFNYNKNNTERRHAEECVFVMET